MSLLDKITLSQLSIAQKKAGRAEIAVETAQRAAGYARSSEKVRELKNRAQSLRIIACLMQRKFATQ